MQHESIISSEDLKILINSKSNLENIGFIMRGVNYLGDKLENVINHTPNTIQKRVSKIVHTILLKVIKANLITMYKEKPFKKPKSLLYKTSVAASGVGLGFFGFAGFSADLLITTKIMMRSILDIARSKGEDIHSIETQLECLSVFALGGKSKDDDGLDTGYYAIRYGLRSAINSSSKFMAENGLKKIVNSLASGSPMMQLVAKIATRYEIASIEKFAAEGIPVAGAIGGGAINLVFMNHFQKMAEAHFSIRQLERKYGEEIVRLKYNEIKLN